MAILPSKELLDGSKDPETTIGEFRVAMGQMQEYLSDLLGENSTDKEVARATLGAVSASDIQGLRHTGALASGTSDAISAAFDPPVTQLTNATTLTVRAIARNETAAPTFRADETSALPIVKGTGQSLEKGDIRSEGHWLDLRYDEVLNKWVLLNPATGMVTPGIVAAHATGTADVIVAHFNPPLVELKDGMKVSIRATTANTSGEPYLQVENFEAYPLVKNIDQSLMPGDISGEGYWIDCQFDGINEKWILQNPAQGVIHSGVPVGTVLYFAAPTPPAGFLIADGSEVGRETHPDLFKTIGTMFGEGDGQTSFNLPDLVNRFAQGSTTPGQKFEAGLPNITGTFGATTAGTESGAFLRTQNVALWWKNDAGYGAAVCDFNASRSSTIYGTSDTVQPPALTLLPCIKAFDATPAIAPVNTMALAMGTTARASRAKVESDSVSSKAWVNFDASSGEVVIWNGRNVLDVIRVEKGVFDIVFDACITVDCCTVMASSSALITAANRESFTGGYFPPVDNRIRVVTGSGFPIQPDDSADINISVLC